MFPTFPFQWGLGPRALCLQPSVCKVGALEALGYPPPADPAKRPNLRRLRDMQSQHPASQLGVLLLLSTLPPLLSPPTAHDTNQTINATAQRDHIKESWIFPSRWPIDSSHYPIPPPLPPPPPLSTPPPNLLGLVPCKRAERPAHTTRIRCVAFWYAPLDRAAALHNRRELCRPELTRHSVNPTGLQGK